MKSWICAFFAIFGILASPFFVSAAENITAAPQFTDSYIFHFRQTDYNNESLIEDEYTLRFKETRGDRLIFTRHDVRTGAETEAIFTKNLDVCILGSFTSEPCAPYFSFPMKEGTSVGGDFTANNTRRERRGKVVKFENKTLPGGVYPAYRIETDHYNKDVSIGGSGAGTGSRITETYYYCLPPVGMMCYYETVGARMNKGLTKNRLIAVKRLPAAETSVGTQPIIPAIGGTPAPGQ